KGFVLPIQRWQGRWRSERWPLRTERLLLVPGDSPIGLRLPLSRLPWIPETEATFRGAVDPTAPVRPLPEPREARAPELQSRERGAAEERGGEVARAGGASPATAGLVRTALAVEPRDGFVN